MTGDELNHLYGAMIRAITERAAAEAKKGSMH